MADPQGVLLAATSPPDTSLQILAGPGTGKTRVLTARVAELVREHKISPSSIWAVTFTKKAANEMRSRLEGLIGPTDANQLVLGTFHSVCVRQIRKHGMLVGWAQDFPIWGEEECARIIYYIALRYAKAEIPWEYAKRIKQRIAKAKAGAGVDPKTAFLASSPLDDPKWMEKVFDDYQATLKISGAMDFEDMIRTCFMLFKMLPFVLRRAKIRHVLVDEFQDTSELQYHFLRELFAASGGCVTVVGDPDQAIYGWRNADTAIFGRMKEDLPRTGVHVLDENYRSTASILAFSLAIIKQDPKRPDKSLFSTRTPSGPKPLLKCFPSPKEESEFIASEIQRVVETSGGLLGYGDCAIFLRENRLPFQLRDALKNKGIPYRTFPEISIFNRHENKSLLVYVWLTLNTANTPLLCRALEEHPIFAHKMSIAELLGRGVDQSKIVFDVVEQICSGAAPDTDPPMKAKAQAFISLIKHLQTLFHQGAGPAELMDYIRYTTNYDSHLEERWPKDAHYRRENIRTLLKFAKKFTRDNGSSVHDFLEFIRRPLSKPNNLDVGKVTILTCHAAKGLEWPVVFVPEVVNGVYPHHYSKSRERIDEDRRVPYVACTRAQCLLYLTLPKKKMMTEPGECRKSVEVIPSDFIRKISPSYFQDEVPRLDEQVLALFQSILGERKKIPKAVLMD